jgi:hypothetical protein
MPLALLQPASEVILPSRRCLTAQRVGYGADD